MPINYKEIIEVASDLASEKNIKVTVAKSAAGAALCGVCCFIGGILLGPAGLAIGGVAGSALAYGTSKDTFRPLADVIRYDLNATQKRRLANNITKAINNFELSDLFALMELLAKNQSVKERILAEKIEKGKHTFWVLSNSPWVNNKVLISMYASELNEALPLLTTFIQKSLEYNYI